jgi:hypothetical protein
VNPLVELEYDELKAVKPRVSVRLNLIQQKCAQHNDDHLKTLLELCRNTGYECPELEDFVNNPTRGMFLKNNYCGSRCKGILISKILLQISSSCLLFLI